VDVAIVALFVLGAAGAVVYGALRGAVARAALASLAVVAVVWLLAFAATATGWRDADGWIDCHDHCDALQHATGSTLAAGVLLGPVLLVIAIVALARRGNRSAERR
jgi:hypothetical protein